MIKCQFNRLNGQINFVEVKGHSEYDDKGQDIVCAAVSTLMISAVNGLTEIVKLDVDYSMDDDGFIQFNVPDIEDRVKNIQCNAILDTLFLGIKSIESEYGDFIIIKEIEGGVTL